MQTTFPFVIILTKEPCLFVVVVGERPPCPEGNQPSLRVPSIHLVAHKHSKHQPRSFNPKSLVPCNPSLTGRDD